VTARFRVLGKLDRSYLQGGTVTIDRASGVLTIKPLRRRRVYSLPLNTVAEIIVSKIIKSEVAACKVAKRRKAA